MKIAILAFGALILAAASFFAARAVTLGTLSSPDFIFESFEQLDSGWLYSDKIGAPAASDVERARVAIGGPLGLSAKEAVYFVTITDSDGTPLQSECTYQVTGPVIDTRWWSLTLYDRVTQHYVPNDINRSSWNSVSVPRGEDGIWMITVSPTLAEGAWLPSQPVPGQSFELMLRVYNPSAALREILPNIDLPRVERISC